MGNVCQEWLSAGWVGSQGRREEQGWALVLGVQSSQSHVMVLQAQRDEEPEDFCAPRV